ncbi:major facilitator superfamily protein [Pelomyxa schiedti]|nr:major facilitator superfamily protein [Pelomyxa schiedti]
MSDEGAPGRNQDDTAPGAVLVVGDRRVAIVGPTQTGDVTSINVEDSQEGAPSSPPDVAGTEAQPLLPGRGIDNTLPTSSLLRVSALGFTFFLLFCAYNATQNLQTAVNADLGFWGLASLYFSFGFLNPFAPFIVNFLGPRLSLLAGIFYVLYISANIYIIPAVYIIASIAAGFGASLIWSAQGVFLTCYSVPHTRITFFTGLFYGIYQTASIVGNLLSAVLIAVGLDLEYVFGILAAVAAVATALFMLLKNVAPKDREGEKSVKDLLLATLILFKERNFILLAPLGACFGFFRAIYWGILPSLVGEDVVGIVMTCAGIGQVAGSFSWGPLAERIGVVRTVCSGGVIALIAMTLLVAILLFRETSLAWFIVEGFLLSLTDSAFETQGQSTVGTFWPEKACGFSAYGLVHWTCVAVGMVVSSFVPPVVIIIVTTVLLCCALFSFAVLMHVIHW